MFVCVTDCIVVVFLKKGKKNKTPSWTNIWGCELKNLSLHNMAFYIITNNSRWHMNMLQYLFKQTCPTPPPPSFPPSLFSKEPAGWILARKRKDSELIWQNWDGLFWSPNGQADGGVNLNLPVAPFEDAHPNDLQDPKKQPWSFSEAAN